jgi:predicted phage-related endonuclease
VSGLTPEQRAIRATGIGASETPIVMEVSPFSTPIDVWLEKTGRTTFEEQDETDEQFIGLALEQAMRDIYRIRTGNVARAVGTTLRHPKHERVLASPDSFVEGKASAKRVAGGAEIKIVGMSQASDWADPETAPLHVELQARQCMAVADVPWWDVIALVGGTGLRLIRIERDQEIEEQLIDVCEAWWPAYVEADQPPPCEDPQAVRRALRALTPGGIKTEHLRKVEDEAVAQAFAWLVTATQMRKLLEHAEDQLTNAFIELVGSEYGVSGPWGKFLHYRVAGRVDWKAVAEEMATDVGGTVPLALIEKHRGKASRVPRAYPFKPKAPKGKAK